MIAKCRHCGGPLPATMLAGMCPRCLAENMLDEAGHTAGGDLQIRGYELIREIGRGGAGVVYLARQIELERLVALKLLVAGPLADTVAATRFEREARGAARLRHPHIVAVHEIGHHRGLPFYSMDLIEGGDLAAYATLRRPSLRQAAALVAKAAHAVHHAHCAGMLHRDLKPANILVDAAGEPYVTDFGLVTAVNGSDGLTRTGEVLGSPGYIAPEQLHGEATVASDVYGLGAILYFLITGRAPFVAARLAELVAAVETGDPLPPRRLDPSIPRDVETIALRALAREPSNRYASASALATDLSLWLAGRPITARPVSLAERTWRYARRNRRLASALAALLFSLVAGVAGVMTQWRRAEGAAQATAAHLYSADLKVASDALLAGDLGLARRTLRNCPPELRDAAWGLLAPFTAGDTEAELARAPLTVTHLAISPDGRVAAAAVQAHNARLFDLAQPGSAIELPGTTNTWWTAFSPDGATLFTAAANVKQWDVAQRAVRREFPGQSGALSPDGRILYTCTGHRFVWEGRPGVVSAWDVADGRLLFTLPKEARLLALSRDGTRLAISDAESTIALHDALDGRALLAPWSSRGRLWHLEFSPDGSQLVASGWSASVRVWELANTTLPSRILTHPLATWQAAFSPDGGLLAVGCSDRQIHLWNTHTWREDGTLRGHDHEVWSLAWLSDRSLVSAGRDPRLLRWNIEAQTPKPGVRHDLDSYTLVWLSGGRIATLRRSAQGPLEMALASVGTREVEMRFPNEVPLAFDPAAGRLWSWCFEGRLRTRSVADLSNATDHPWRQAPGREILDQPRVVPAAGVAWMPLKDGSLEIRRLDDTASTSRHADIFARPANAAAISPDGRWFVWSGGSAELFAIDLRTGERTALEGHYYDVASLAFSPDGKSFVSGGTDGQLFAWDSTPPHRRRQLGAHQTSVGQLAFSPDGRVLASHEPRRGIHLWHPRTAREVGFLEVPDEGAGEWIGFSPDSRWLALRENSGNVRIFPIAEDLVERH